MKYIKHYENILNSPFIIGEYLTVKLLNINKIISILKVISTPKESVEENGKIEDNIFVYVFNLTSNYQSDIFYNTKTKTYFHCGTNYKYEILYKGFNYEEALKIYELETSANKYNL